MNRNLLASSLLLGTVAVTSLVPTQPAQALNVFFDGVDQFATIETGDVGTLFTYEFSQGFVDGQLTEGLNTKATFTLLEAFDGTNARFQIDLTNDSGGPIDSSRVSALGFNVDRAFSASVNPGTSEFDGVSSGNVPGLGNVDVCFTAGANCAGGGGGGVLQGATQTFFPTLTFAPGTANFTLTDFFVRYQSIYSDELNLSDASGVGIPTPGLIPGLIGMGLAALRKRKEEEEEEVSENEETKHLV